MKTYNTKIKDLLVIELDKHKDDRGNFFEFHNIDKYKKIGITDEFVQDNCAYSKQGAIRGLHYQVGENAQGKLASVLYGKVLDVAVDIRFGSPTYGQHVAIELSAENNLQFWIPPSFAHGFSTLSDEVIFFYKCTAGYSKQDERSIIYNDKDLSIDWKIDKPTISAKDKTAPDFKTIEKNFVY